MSVENIQNLSNEGILDQVNQNRGKDFRVKFIRLKAELDLSKKQLEKIYQNVRLREWKFIES